MICGVLTFLAGILILETNNGTAQINPQAQYTVYI